MRVLSILPFPVLPLTHGGRVRAYRLAVGLARAGATVDLCCPWHPAFPLRPFHREGVTIRPLNCGLRKPGAEFGTSAAATWSVLYM